MLLPWRVVFSQLNHLVVCKSFQIISSISSTTNRLRQRHLMIRYATASQSSCTGGNSDVTQPWSSMGRCDPCRISLCRVHHRRTPTRRQMLACIEVGDLPSKPSKAARVIMDINLNLVEHSVVCKKFSHPMRHAFRSFEKGNSRSANWNDWIWSDVVVSQTGQPKRT